MANKFGWCMDNHHESCVFGYWWEEALVECSCECHEGKPKPEIKKPAPEAPRKPSRTRKKN